jgi:outer membrane protein assembly factor BamB
MYAVCVDRMSGKVIHDLKLFEVGKPGPKNATNTYASPTPVIEAGRVFVHFGSYGTACLDTATGKTLWSRNDLPCDHEVAPGSSPIIVGNRLIVHLDGMDHQYVIALDKATGATVWRTPRSVDYSKNEPLARKAFSTPAVTGSGAAMQLISTGADATMGYDAATGRELWQVRYKGFSNIMRPVVGGGMTFINTGFGRPHLMGIRLGGSGDVTATHVAWDLVKNAPLTCSPILLDGLLYVVSDGGFATCLDAATGAVVWTHKLGGEFGASPVLAAGRLYFFGKKGVTTVMEPGRTAKVLATNQLDPSAPVMASPAVAGGALFLRSKTHLYRIAAQR